MKVYSWRCTWQGNRGLWKQWATVTPSSGVMVVSFPGSPYKRDGEGLATHEAKILGCADAAFWVSKLPNQISILKAITW